MDELITWVRGTIRLIVFKIIILTFLAWSYLCHTLVRNPHTRLLWFSRNSQFFCGLMVKGLNMDLSVVNEPPADKKFLLVSNHMGFVDILILASRMPMLFVTSIEMRETPFLGLLTEMGGCIYVERRSRTKILSELDSIVETLKRGFRVTLYPESTSTNGEKVLPFKKTLIMAAAHAGVPIQPVVVNYREINGQEFNQKTRDHVCWYGDMSFVTAMWKTVSLKSVKAEIEFLEQVHITPDDDRKVVAEKIHGMIAAKFVAVKSVPALGTDSGTLGIDPT